MSGLNITVNDQTTPWLQALKKSLESSEVVKVIGHTAALTTQRHLGSLAASRHRSHVPHNFYADAARATSYSVQGKDAVIVVDKEGIAQRYYGGILKPRKSKYLTIPADSKAHGKRAREFSGLFYVRLRSGTEALARREQGGIRFYYWLKKEITQTPDSSIMPNEQDFFNDLEPVLTDFIGRMGK